MVKATAKAKLSLWEEVKTKGVDTMVLDMTKELEAELRRKELAIRRKADQIEKMRTELLVLQDEAVRVKVRILKERYLSKSQKSS